MEKEIQQYTSVKDWEYEARKQIEQRFSTSCLRVRNRNISDNDFYVISFANSPYIYKVLIYTQEFIPDLADPVEPDGVLSIIRMDTYDFLFEKKDFYFISEAIEYIAS